MFVTEKNFYKALSSTKGAFEEHDYEIYVNSLTEQQRKYLDEFPKERTKQIFDTQPNIQSIIDTVLFDEDRIRVLNVLKQEEPNRILLVMWLNSNIDISNKDRLLKIIEYSWSDYFYEMVALMKIQKRKQLVFPKALSDDTQKIMEKYKMSLVQLKNLPTEMSDEEEKIIFGDGNGNRRSKKTYKK